MTMTLTHYDTTVSIATPDDDLTITRVVDELIRPLLLAAGYHPDLVTDALGQQ